MSFFTKKSFKLPLILLVSLFLFISIKNAYTQPPPPPIPTYTWSAHGNTSYGVNRTSIAAFGYSRGNCAHCHEQHASIGGTEPAPNTGDDEGPDIYLLFKMLWGTGDPPVDPQQYEFCYGCHTDSGSVQTSFSRTNYSYSYWAGGNSNLTCPDSIYESFQFVRNNGSSQSNCGSTVGSSHMLRNIRNYLTNQWGFSSDNNEVDPCSGCHNPHRAQRDPHTSSGRFQGQKLYSAVSLPSDHSKDNNAWTLWGDDTSERMSVNASSGGSVYQAPCRYPWSSTCSSGPPPSCLQCEPDGSNIQDGSNMFDSVTFCLKCHQNSLTSTRLQALYSRNTFVIDWGSTGNQHGHYSDSGSTGGGCCLNAPYDINAMVNGTPDYVLSCLDCHEPHGSPNEFLLRETVNGKQVQVTVSGAWCNWCGACHTAPHGTIDCGGMVIGCGNCHTHNQSGF